MEKSNKWWQQIGEQEWTDIQASNSPELAVDEREVDERREFSKSEIKLLKRFFESLIENDTLYNIEFQYVQRKPNGDFALLVIYYLKTETHTLERSQVSQTRDWDYFITNTIIRMNGLKSRFTIVYFIDLDDWFFLHVDGEKTDSEEKTSHFDEFYKCDGFRGLVKLLEALAK